MKDKMVAGGFGYTKNYGCDGQLAQEKIPKKIRKN